ncbi:hypothetical protein BH11PSE4_BH11PSE4_27120 [soil metagenome]
MGRMNKSLTILASAAIAAVLACSTASAQMPPQGGATLLPPPPAPPPPIAVPVVPQLDALPVAPKAQTQSRGSFGDRVTGCLQDGAAAGLGPNERAAYSRSCANR